jgi:4-alpha-glucanotransferase
LTDDEAAVRCGGRRPGFRPHDDDTPEHRAANLAAGDALLRMILGAAGEAEVVAEDLGTVPEYVRPHLLSLDIPGFKICQWEDDGHGHAVQGADYPQCSFATYGTHDHEPMRTLWERLRREVETGSAAEQAGAAQQLRYLCQFAWLHPEHGPYPAYDQRMRRTLLSALFHCNSRLAAFTLTDLFGEEIRFNVPGVAGEQNWSARLPMCLEEMRSASPWREDCEWLADTVRAAGRTGPDNESDRLEG